MISKNIEFESSFYHFGENVDLAENIVLQGVDKIHLGNNLIIKQGCEIAINLKYFNKDIECNLKIDDNSFFNRYVCIETFNEIIIGKYVMVGPQVYISDKDHEYQYFKAPAMLQGYLQNSNKIIIKDGAWIGAGSKIIGNVTIGFGSVIGANTVLVKDVPDHCLVAGTPGKIIKICDYKTDKWINVKNNPKLLKEILLKRGKFNGYDYDFINGEIEKNRIKKEQDTKNSEELVKYKNLIDTVIEGLNYVNSQLTTGEFNNSTEIFNEMIIGISTILSGVSNIMNITEHEKENIKDKINKYLELVVSAYEQRDVEKIILNIDTKLIPSIKEIQNYC